MRRLLLAVAALAIAGESCRQPEARPKVLTPVRAAAVETAAASGETTYSANIVANTQVGVAFRVGGYVAELHQVAAGRALQEGDFIQKGTVLARVRQENTAEANAYFLKKATLERRDMAEHGLDGHDSFIRISDWKVFAVDTEDMDRRLKMDRLYGLNKDRVVLSFPEGWQNSLMARRGLRRPAKLAAEGLPPEFFRDVTAMVESIESERKRRGWPEFIYYPIDEPRRDPDSVRFTLSVLKAVKQVPGVRVYLTANPARKEFEPLWPYVDVWCSQPFLWSDEVIKRRSAEKGIEFWSYPNHVAGENDHTPLKGARMTWGFGFWRSGYKGLMPWIYQYVAGSPFNYLDNVMMDVMNRSTPEGEPIPVALWEAYREGIDDGRYIHTLQTLIDEARRSGFPKRAALAEDAEAALKGIWKAIRPQEKYQYGGMWDSADFDRYRRLIVSHILSLLGQQESKAKTDGRQ